MDGDIINLWDFEPGDNVNVVIDPDGVIYEAYSTHTAAIAKVLELPSIHDLWDLVKKPILGSMDVLQEICNTTNFVTIHSGTQLYMPMDGPSKEQLNVLEDLVENDVLHPDILYFI